MQQFSIPEISLLNLEKFKNTLRKCEYTHEQFLQSGINPFAYSQYDLPLFAYRQKTLTSFSILSHLFFLGKRITVNDIRKIFHEQDIDELLKIKIFERVDSAHLQSSVLILPYKKYYFACDFVLQSDDRYKKRPKNFELVYPVNLDSITLSESSLKQKVDTVLDLCCGCGILGIVASTHSKKVMGIDINPRAINFSTFNVLFNNISNCTFLCGDLYEPVKEEKFDLILSNPPYEISPYKTNLFQDGGKDGFKILKKIIEGIGAHLTKNGFCQIITKFAETHNESKQQILKKWLHHKNFHIHFLKLYSLSVEETASSVCTDSLRNTGKMDYGEFSSRIIKIMTYFDAVHLAKISFGLITIKKASYFHYVEQIFDNSNVLAAELSGKLQYIIYKYFALSLGFSGIFYFLRHFLYKMSRKIFSLR